jgi:hypothetical protein
MFGQINSIIEQNFSLNAQDCHAEHTLLLSTAIKVFNQAMSRGRLARLWSCLCGRSGCLVNLYGCGLRVTGSHYAGLQTVPINRICGSEGKSNDFDTRFRPLSERLRDRWVSVFVARYTNISLPAVELVQVGDRYFVRDGHHRISVAVALGQRDIDAEVTVWEVVETPAMTLGTSQPVHRLFRLTSIIRLI